MCVCVCVRMHAVRNVTRFVKVSCLDFFLPYDVMLRYGKYLTSLLYIDLAACKATMAGLQWTDVISSSRRCGLKALNISVLHIRKL